jgi:hypothetical protein
MVLNIRSHLLPMVLLASSLLATSSLAQEPSILATGDAVITGFSGVVQPHEPLPEGVDNLDETFIDPEGISARITPLSSPGFQWDARVWPGETFKDFKAKDIGQVFGVTIDDEKSPNIYLTATSAYGLHALIPDQDNDGRPERIKKGANDAIWMPGMWGTTDANDPSDATGGPNSIWKIDGKSGDVSLFANVRNVDLGLVDNSGAGLGNISYDKAHKQLFVSDLSTGLIHRFNLQGEQLDTFDAGGDGFAEAGLAKVSLDPNLVLDIGSKDFDSEDPETWAFTDENRRVYGLAVNKDRLYYALVGQSQIWSVGLEEKTGEFLKDARWELDVPKKPKKLPVTDMLFTSQGAMVLAQRSTIESTYDYANFAEPGKARVYRYWLESPEDDPNTPSRWIPEPEEYAVGFEPEHRASNGGIALNHGYTRDGYIDASVCEASLWTTADNLRRNDELMERLLPGGPQVIDGLQGMPTGPVKQYPPEKNNTPPWTSYMLDAEPANTDQTVQTDDPLQWSDVTTQGWIGDVAVLRGCAGAIADGGGGGGGGGGYGGWPTDYPYYTNYTGGGGGGGGGGSCIIGTPGCNPPPPPPSCAKQTGTFICDTATGSWSYQFSLSSGAMANADTVKFSFLAAGHSMNTGLMSPFNPPSSYLLQGGASGQTMGADVCLFNSTEMKSGKPFACCKTSFDVPAPNQKCVKK